MNKDLYGGEVVATSLWMASLAWWDTQVCPDFGAVVAIEGGAEPLWGIVYDIQMLPAEPSRHVHRYQKTLAELALEQPQLGLFTYTRVELYLVGQGEAQSCMQQKAIPPLHASARVAKAEERKVVLASGLWIPIVYQQASELVRDLLIQRLWRSASAELDEAVLEPLVLQLLEISTNNVRLFR